MKNTYSKIIRINKTVPLKLTIYALFFLYVIQYPIIKIFAPFATPKTFSIYDWGVAYIFVIYSSLILLLSIILGMNGLKENSIIQIENKKYKNGKKKKYSIIIYAIIICALWSYLMLKLKIGITIAITDHVHLPFKLVGFLFYGRLILQPLVLIYLASLYKNSDKKFLITILLFILGSWVSYVSGSRFLSIMFSLPILSMYQNKKGIFLFAFVVSLLVIIANLSRYFFLPFELNDIELIEIYGNNIDQTQIIDDGIWKIPFQYLAIRSMGMYELLLTLNFDSISSGFFDSILLLISYFLPISFDVNRTTIRDILNVSIFSTGGYGLGFFPNYWVEFGGNIFAYILGIILTGLLLGRAYLVWASLFIKLHLEYLNNYIFFILFLLTYEARSYTLVSIIIIGYLFSLKNFRIILSKLLSKVTASKW